jgi:hypothetical protein
MSLFSRIGSLYRNRGFKGLLRVSYGRLVFRSWHVRVYEDDPRIDRRPGEWPRDTQITFLGVHGELETGIRKLLESTGSMQSFRELRNGEELYVVYSEGKPVSFGFSYLRCFQLQVLGLPDDAVLVGGCYTVPANRGQGLYRQALSDVALRWRLRKVPVFMEVQPENAASIRGIEAAGYRFVREVESWILLGRIVRIRNIREGNDVRWRLAKRL